jgi:hypothetical protein
MKQAFQILLSLTFLFTLNNAQAFNPQSILSATFNVKNSDNNNNAKQRVTYIPAGQDCVDISVKGSENFLPLNKINVVIPGRSTGQTQAPLREFHFVPDFELRSKNIPEFTIIGSICAARNHVNRVISDQPYELDNTNPIVQFDTMNAFNAMGPAYPIQALRLNFVGGIYLKLIFLNNSRNNAYMVTPINNSNIETSQNALTTADMNYLFADYFTFNIRQEVSSPDDSDFKSEF